MRNPGEKSPSPSSEISTNPIAGESPHRLPDSIADRFASVYDELRRIAYRLKQGDGSATLNPTALVHEAYLRLAVSDAATFGSAEHFRNTAVMTMRHLLVDAARRRIAERHGGGAPLRNVEELTDTSVRSALDVPEQILDIHIALERVEAEDATLARVFECHFFAGFTQAEIAGHFGMSDKVARNRLRLAKACVVAALTRGTGSAMARL